MAVERTWPAWHPEQELKADHLLGLEDYLVARASLADESASGVDLLDWRNNLIFAVQGYSLLISVHRLRGVTPAGEPVRLKSGDTLETSVSLLVEPVLAGQMPLPAQVAVLDLWIDVNPEAPSGTVLTAGDETNPSGVPTAASVPRGINGDEPLLDPSHKLRLRATRVARDEGHPVQPTADAHSLYLGRYRWAMGADGQSTHNLYHPPMVRRFGGFWPRDEAWWTWVSPLQSRIELLVQQAEQAGAVQTVAGSLMALEVMRLAFEWVALPLPMLCRRLRFVKWLSERHSGQAEAGPGQPQALPNLRDFNAALSVDELVDGPSLPEVLAGLLPMAMASGVQQASDLPGAFSTLLRRLTEHDVDYHAPIGELEQWVTELERLRSAGRGAGGMRVPLDDLAREFERPDAGASVWGLAVMMVTAAVIETSTGQPFAPGSLGRLRRGGGTGTAEAVQVLEDLYRDQAATRRAGPLAFYWIAKAAAEIPDVARSSGKAGQYIARSRGPKPSATSRPAAAASPRPDRVTSYLLAVQGAAEAAPSTLRSVSWQPKRQAAGGSSRRTAPIRPDAVRIALIGPSGTGKTTLLRQLCTARSADPPVRLQLGLSVVDREGLTIADGTAELANLSLPIKIVEVGGSHMPALASGLAGVDAPSAAIRDSHLVIVTLDAASIAAGAMNQTVEQLSRVVGSLLARSNPVIALAYTKADEYGVLTPQELRLVGEQQGDSLRQAVAGSQDAWDKIAGAGVQAHSDSRKHGGAVITRRGAAIAATESAPTRAWLLSRTRPLWTSIVSAREPSPLLNAYFLCADPKDARFTKAEDRGILQLLVDFFGQLEGRV